MKKGLRFLDDSKKNNELSTHYKQVKEAELAKYIRTMVLKEGHTITHIHRNGNTDNKYYYIEWRDVDDVDVIRESLKDGNVTGFHTLDDSLTYSYTAEKRIKEKDWFDLLRPFAYGYVGGLAGVAIWHLLQNIDKYI